jgi:hypothetical protein
MAGIAAYRKAFKEFKKQHGVVEQDEDEPEPRETPNRRRFRGAKHKDKGGAKTDK